MVLVLVSLGLAALLGFAAHRASICTVRAVAEVMSTGRAYYFVSFGKSVLWVLAVAVPLFWIDPGNALRLQGWELSSQSLLGGLMFGMGAVLNGGCSFSTLARLADGQLRMLATLTAFTLGVLLELEIVRAGYLSNPLPGPSLIHHVAPYAGALSMLLWLWAIYEARRLWQTRPPGYRLKDLVLGRQYRLSTAAMLMGLASGTLYLIHGAWTYTGALRQGVEGLVIAGETPTPVRVSLLAAVFAGMLLSTRQRGSFRLDWRMSPAWAMNFLGGMLMGIGATLVPGGNDALVLYAIPMSSIHAWPAYGALLTGIAIAVLIMRRALGVEMRIDCQSDVCRASQSRHPVLS